MIHAMRLSIIILSLLIQSVQGLNILISSKDSWVSKDTRHLYASLKAQNHTVLLVAPLYNGHNSYDDSISSNPSLLRKRLPDDFNDGGDFGHLLPVHQTYFKNLKKLSNFKSKNPKNVITKRDSDEFEDQFNSSNLILNKNFGQDPLEPMIWYINSSPLNTLLITYDIILPTYYPDFIPDLVILGPNEGSTFTNNKSSNKNNDEFYDEDDFDNSINLMSKLSQLKNYPVLSVSTQDNHHVYFQDEKFFKIQQTPFEKNFKKNVFTKNIAFVNSKIIEIVDNLFDNNIDNKFLDEKISINLNFPSMNHHDSYCATKAYSKEDFDSNPNFKQAESNNNIVNTNSIINLPRFELVEDDIVKRGDYNIQTFQHNNSIIDNRLQTQYQLNNLNYDSTFVDKKSYYYQENKKNYINRDPTNNQQDIFDNEELNEIINNNSDEFKILKDCQISLSVNHLFLGNGLSKEMLNVDNFM